MQRLKKKKDKCKGVYGGWKVGSGTSRSEP